MEQIFLPTLHSFSNDNIFTGSCGMLRFRAAPNVVQKQGSRDVDLEKSSIRVESWHGLLCYEKSEMEQERTFPMSDAGLAQMRQWLEAQI